jgi:hypothetical protein
LSASSTTGTIAWRCALEANSGTTPPYFSWIFWLEIMLLKIILSLQTEAAVSSHEDSIARMVIIVCKGMASKKYRRV